MSAIKILHASDFHLGVTFRGFIGDNVQEVRKNDFYRNVQRVFNEALKRKVDIIIISGDVFHRSDPSNKDLVFISEQIGNVVKHGIKVVIIAGNHDRPKVLGSVNPLLALVKANAPNFYFIQSAPKKPLLIDVKGKSIAIVAMPYIDPRAIRSLNISYSGLFRRTINKLIEMIPSDVDYKIFVGHLTLSGAKINDIHGIYLNEPSLNLEDIYYREFDYVALGHVHTPQKIRENVYYAGSIERIDFSERNENKGFLIVELLDQVNVKQFELECREMITTNKINIRHKSNPRDFLIEILKSMDISPGALLKINLEIDESSWKVLERYMDDIRKFLLDEKKVLGYIIHKSYPEASIETVSESIHIKPIKEVILDYIDALQLRISMLKKRVKELAVELMNEAGLY